MTPKTILLSALVGLTLPAMAQTKDGGISADMLRQIEKQQPAAAQSRAIANAIAGNKIDDLARNPQAQRNLTTYFSVETPAQSIHDQKQSGRCWMFSGFNVLRANFAKQHGDSLRVEFSQAYLFFYDQLEKANLMLQGVVDCAKKPLDDQRVQFFFKSPIGDGGTFCGVSDLADKYGLVPMEVMPESYSAENTSKMRQLLNSKLREYGLELRRMVADGKSQKAVQARKTEQLATIYRMLTLTIGEPVKQFTYAFRDKNGRPVEAAKTYTPREFFQATVGEKLQGTFIMVMNDPRREYYKTYEVDFDRHTYDGTNWKYLNLPAADIAQLAIKSLQDGRKLYSSYDVGKQFDRSNGFLSTDNYDYASLFSTTFPMTKADRIWTFDSGSTHAMTLSAVNLDAQGKPTAWKVENSWGPAYGQKGSLVMTNEWWEEYMFRLVVDKKYVSSELLKMFEQKPVMVMPEDPLFAEDE